MPNCFPKWSYQPILPPEVWVSDVPHLHQYLGLSDLSFKLGINLKHLIVDLHIFYH